MKRSPKKKPAKSKTIDAPVVVAGGWPVRFHVPDDARIKTIPTPAKEPAKTGNHFLGLPDMRPVCEGEADL